MPTTVSEPARLQTVRLPGSVTMGVCVRMKPSASRMGISAYPIYRSGTWRKRPPVSRRWGTGRQRTGVYVRFGIIGDFDGAKNF